MTVRQARDKLKKGKRNKKKKEAVSGAHGLKIKNHKNTR